MFYFDVRLNTLADRATIIRRNNNIRLCCGFGIGKIIVCGHKQVKWQPGACNSITYGQKKQRRRGRIIFLKYAKKQQKRYGRKSGPYSQGARQRYKREPE
jgi:hypothetical protein